MIMNREEKRKRATKADVDKMVKLVNMLADMVVKLEKRVKELESK